MTSIHGTDPFIQQPTRAAAKPYVSKDTVLGVLLDKGYDEMVRLLYAGNAFQEFAISFAEKYPCKTFIVSKNPVCTGLASDLIRSLVVPIRITPDDIKQALELRVQSENPRVYRTFQFYQDLLWIDESPVVSIIQAGSWTIYEIGPINNNVVNEK